MRTLLVLLWLFRRGIWQPWLAIHRTESTLCCHAGQHVYSIRDLFSDAAAIDPQHEHLLQCRAYRNDDGHHCSLHRVHESEYQALVADAVSEAVERATAIQSETSSYTTDN